jgi:hypothetical protein
MDPSQRRLVEKHLDELLRSPAFRGTEKQAQALRLMVESALEGTVPSAAELASTLHKGRVDDETVKAVRACCREIRRKLPGYYEQGAQGPVRFRLPERGYQLAFEFPAGRRRWWGRVAAAAVVVLGGLAVLVYVTGWSPTRLAVPVRCHATEDVLFAIDDRDRELWSKSVSRPMKIDDEEGRCVVMDVTGDGRPEVLANYVPEERTKAGAKLMCFNAQGDELSRYRYGRVLHAGGERLSTGFRGKKVEPVEVGGRHLVMAAATQTQEYATEVSLIDPETGTAVERYYHPGYIFYWTFADFDGDGADEVALGGINNPGLGDGYPAVAILDLPFSAGGEEVDFFGNPGPKPLRYLLFSRTDVSKAEPNAERVSELWYDNGKLMVYMRAPRQVVYTLELSGGNDVRVIDVVATKEFTERHEELYRRERLDHPFTREELMEYRVLDFDHVPDGNSPEVRKMFGD